MLSDRLLREHPDDVRAGLRRRHAGAEDGRALDEWLALDAERRALATQRDALAQAAHAGKTAGIDLSLTQARRALADLEGRLRALALRLPNLPDERVPEGAGDDANVELRRWGEPPAFAFATRSHEELGAALGILDLPRATKLAGPRFPLFVGAGARLVRALASLMLDLARERGYIEVAPPHLLRSDTLVGTGHLPHFAGDL